MSENQAGWLRAAQWVPSRNRIKLQLRIRHRRLWPLVDLCP